MNKRFVVVVVGIFVVLSAGMAIAYRLTLHDARTIVLDPTATGDDRVFVITSQNGYENMFTGVAENTAKVEPFWNIQHQDTQASVLVNDDMINVKEFGVQFLLQPFAQELALHIACARCNRIPALPLYIPGIENMANKKSVSVSGVTAFVYGGEAVHVNTVGKSLQSVLPAGSAILMTDEIRSRVDMRTLIQKKIPFEDYCKSIPENYVPPSTCLYCNSKFNRKINRNGTIAKFCKPKCRVYYWRKKNDR